MKRRMVMMMETILARAQKVKVVVFDLDGTLIPREQLNGQDLSLLTEQALTKLKAQGYIVVLATARNIFYCDRLIKHPAIDYVLLYNGALIYDCRQQKTLHQSTVGFVDLQLIQQFLKQSDQQKLIKRLTIHSHKQIFVQSFNTTKLGKHLEPLRQQVLETKELQSQAQGLLLTIETKGQGSSQILGDQINVWLNQHESQLAIQSQWDSGLFLARQGVNKMSAIAWLCKQLNFTTDQVLAFGDAHNDIPMLQGCGLGVAMLNGSKQAQAVADLIAPAAETDGCVQVLKQLQMI